MLDKVLFKSKELHISLKSIPKYKAENSRGIFFPISRFSPTLNESVQFSIRFRLACSIQSNQRTLLVERFQQQTWWWLNKEHPSGPHFRPNEVTSLRLLINTQVIKIWKGPACDILGELSTAKNTFPLMVPAGYPRLCREWYSSRPKQTGEQQTLRSQQTELAMGSFGKYAASGLGKNSYSTKWSQSQSNLVTTLLKPWVWSVTRRFHALRVGQNKWSKSPLSCSPGKTALNLIELLRHRRILWIQCQILSTSLQHPPREWELGKHIDKLLMFCTFEERCTFLCLGSSSVAFVSWRWFLPNQGLPSTVHLSDSWWKTKPVSRSM